MHSTRANGLPTGPRSRSHHRAVLKDYEHSDSYHRSDDSASSTGSSLFERMKTGYASSITSLDDDPPKGRSLRTRRMEPKSPEVTSPTSSFGLGDGSKVWNRMAVAASELTVSVSKAWASNIVLHAGEETPPGKESRLTRAMKAYHREKAQSPEDLPPWLFTADERKPVISPTSPRHRATQESQSPQRSRGLREVYDAAAAQTQPFTAVANSLRSPPPSRTYQDEKGPSKATDRLKALRDAKRSALTGNSASSHQSDTSSIQAEPRARIGLPSGPRKHY